MKIKAKNPGCIHAKHRCGRHTGEAAPFPETLGARKIVSSPVFAILVSLTVFAVTIAAVFTVPVHVPAAIHTSIREEGIVAELTTTIWILFAICIVIVVVIVTAPSATVDLHKLGILSTDCHRVSVCTSNQYE